MKNPFKLKEKADDSILDELIAACESRMASKFKKEEPEAELEVSVVELDDDKESDDLDEEKLKKLLEMYKSLKD